MRVVTGVASNGAVLKGGDTAFAIDGRPTVVVPGAVPAWRAIDGTTSDGVDVHQVETFLQSKGFTDGGAMKVDDHVTSGTVAAIKAWQTSMEIDATGRIELGEIVFLTGDVTVVAVNAKVGQVVTPGDTMLDVRSGTPFVDVSTDSSWAKVGDPVKVSTGRSTLTGTVATFASGIARVGLAADAVVTDGAAATVTLSRAKVSGQLLVPASAILRDDTAGPTVMVKRGGSTRVARVAVVASANGIAAVRSIDGDLDTSDRVSQY